MKLAVQDANIIIDLISINLWQYTLQLNIEIYTTDFVIGELDRGQAEHIDLHATKTTFKIKGFGADEIEKILDLNEKVPALSVADCSVLLSAASEGAMILTGDKRLRNEAQSENLNVHGILWIFDQLLAQSIIDFATARLKLIELMQINSRLPAKECLLRIEKWEKVLSVNS